MDLNNQQKGQNNQEQGRSIPPRGSVLRSHNLTNIFPSQPASSVRQHAPPTAEQLLDARRRLGLSSLGTARSGVPSSLNHTGTYQYQSRAATKSFMPSLPTGFPPRPPRVSPFENGYVSNPNQTPSAAEPKVNQPTAVTTCPKYSPPRAVSIPKPGSEFVSPSDPVAQARLIKKMNGGYNSAGIRAVPPYNPTIPRYPTSSDPLVLKNSNLKISKLWAAKYPSLKEKPPVPDFQRLGFVPAPTTSGAPKPSRPVLPTQRQSQVNPVSEPKETDVHRPQDIASVPQTPMHSEPSRQELQHIQGSVVGNSNAESPTSPPSGLASRFRLSIRPVASSIFQNRRSHTSKTLFSEPSMADSDGDIIMTDCKPQISSLKRKISCVEDPMESEIDAGRELRRPITELRMIDADSLEALVECACGLQEVERSQPTVIVDNTGDAVMRGIRIPGSWPLSPVRPSANARHPAGGAFPNGSGPDSGDNENSIGSPKAVCPRCRPGMVTPSSPYGDIPLKLPHLSLERKFSKLELSDPVLTPRTKTDPAQSTPTFVTSPPLARSQRDWIFHAKRIFGTVKRQVTRFCKACLTPCRSCPPASKLIKRQLRQKQRDEERKKRKPRFSAVRANSSSPLTVPTSPPAQPPTPTSSPPQSPRKPISISRPVRKDMPSTPPKQADVLHGVRGGRVMKGHADWRGRSTSSPNRTGPRRLSTSKASPKKLVLSRAMTTPNAEKLEASMAAWLAPPFKSDLPAEAIPIVQPETPTIAPSTAIEAESVTAPEPTVTTRPDSLTTPVRGTESAPAEIDNQEPRKGDVSVHWMPSNTPLKRPISSIQVYDPQSPPAHVAPAKEQEDSKRPIGRPPPRTHQGPVIRPLPAKWGSKVDKALSQPDSRQLGTTLGGDALTRRDFATCATPLAWLNDEIINAYLAVIVDYARRSIGNSGRHDKPKYHAFNTFFYSSLRDKGYESVRRWASRAKIGGSNLLDVDTVFVPVHHQAHWTLMVVKPSVRTIEHFDSLGGSSARHIANIKQWLRGELGNLFVEEEWRVLQTVSPQQNNGSDCGVFLLTTAKLVSLQQPLSYGPKDIPAIRKRIVAELMNGGFEGDFDPKDEFPVRSLL